MTPLIRRLIDLLEENDRASWHEYAVPGAWVGAYTPVRFPSAPAYLLHQLRRIDALRRSRQGASEWKLDTAVAYNAMVRHVTSYDHGPMTEADGWQCTGTFLKLASLLPYMASLGVDTVVLLPITEIGTIGRKGQLGSPYAVRHPFRLCPSLAEPAIDMTIEDQARVFIELCHLLGMKVILETVLRTVSIDSDLIGQHPEWFYWVDESRLAADTTFHAPRYKQDQLDIAASKVEAGNLVDLPAPDESYQALFDLMPLRVERDARGWKGIGPRGKVLRVPGAFADWPPDDPQPAWTDVTYYRLHDHPMYRYMAYNTIRMFERELDQPAYRQTSLWNTIAGIIPHYIRMFNIDGAMIDMGHALPVDLRTKVISECRRLRPGFVLLEENFALTSASAKDGYDAVIGYLPFDGHDPAKLSAFVRRVADGDVPIRYFGTPESHNTPRVASRLPSRAGCAVSIFLRLLPMSFGFVHAGMELGEVRPVNTGLGFTSDELESIDEGTLALFNDVPLPWDAGASYLEWFRAKVREVADKHVAHLMRPNDRVVPVTVDDPDVVAYLRRPVGERRGVLVCLNCSSSPRTIRLHRSVLDRIVMCAVVRGLRQNEEELTIDLAGADVMIIPTLHHVTTGGPTRP